ncbi:SRPBCC domain-containing protein [Prauserella muralis]|uniref:Uncharacterized protein n=1 Tax=Prauserella muralis TaxID=588067 RepID=A0A2V4ANA8_9PSEU|nr:SRPBCC domain-containing protein [Prauserella muralis]PXY22173.1 hypothetical protein BAY60_19965 [Prauserella muralis]TWE27778.1 uncharacterized protein YndB with AHSA1/START domain [Prauserella muralis]
MTDAMLNHDTRDRDARTITIVRVFDAPRELVFGNWVRAEDVAGWFAPDGYTVTGCELDARAGGQWWVEYRSATGETHRESGRFREIAEPDRLVFTLTQSDDQGHTGPETVVTVSFAATGTGTEMTFEQTGFPSTGLRDGNAEGWDECFGKLDRQLAETEIRREFEEWFASAAAKDLDAVMTKIADDAVSYEHEAPLVHTGAERIREVCRHGFSVADGDFRWDIPDLRVIVRDDIAVTWGLNRMRVDGPAGRHESWSRGTRIFQKVGGRWRMIHQHVSFPYDPRSGRAVLDAAPAD